jgi:ribose 1,5-bisphosphokinase
VLIVGPSGAGKDAILQHVRNRLAHDGRFVFPRRIVTRPANSAEDHDTVSPEAFDTLLRGKGLALHWQAHELNYGIPADMDDAVRRGTNTVFNTSRRVVQAARTRYLNVAVVMINAPVQLRAARLAARDREDAEGVATRLKRVVDGFSVANADLVIDNAGTLEQASAQLVEWLQTNVQVGR